MSPKARYDWPAADVAVRAALVRLFAAQWHLAHRDRVPMLIDLVAVENEIVEMRRALLAVPPEPQS